MIDTDLSRAQVTANICIEKRYWWSGDVPPLTIEGRQQYRGIIAPELSNTAWLTVSVAVEAVQNLNMTQDLYTRVAEQMEAGLTSITKELEDWVEELTAIINGATAKEIEDFQTQITALRNKNEEQITAFRVRLTEITDRTAKGIIPMLNDIKAGRLALTPFMADIGKPQTLL